MAMLKFRAPPLPIAGPEYKQDYFAQLIRALGLYFNQLDSQTPVQWEQVSAGEFLGGVFVGDGTGLAMPHIAASDSTDQYAAASDTPTPVAWDTLGPAAGFVLNNDGTATALYGGIYKIDYSLQFVNTDNVPHDAFVWLRVGDADVPDSSSQFTLAARKSAGNPSALVAYSSVVFAINPGQKVALYWATNKAYATSPAADGIYMHAIAPITTPYNRPGNPSAVGSIVFLSALPTPTVTGVSAFGGVGRVTVTTS